MLVVLLKQFFLPSPWLDVRHFVLEFKFNSFVKFSKIFLETFFIYFGGTISNKKNSINHESLKCFNAISMNINVSLVSFGKLFFNQQ